MKKIDEVLEKVKTAARMGLPYVIFRPPGENHAEVWIQNDARLEYADDFLGSGFIMSPFDVDKRPVLFSVSHSQRYRTGLQKKNTSNSSSGKRVFPSDNIDKQKHIELVSRAISHIEKGELVKVVLSRSEYVPLKEMDLADLFLKMADKYPAAFVYVWFHPDIGLWAGASPETLVRSKGAHFNTMALAGTQPFRGTLDVNWGQKERTEQQLVTDHIAESLSEFSLQIGPTNTKKAGSLLHLCSEIKGTLNKEDNLKILIEKLHPTPAVCGLPRDKAREFILKEEGYDRGFYTGFLGVLNVTENEIGEEQGNSAKTIRSALFVNLRCMQLLNTPQPGALIYTGGGVTIKSDPAAEWQETTDKGLVMKSVLFG